MTLEDASYRLFVAVWLPGGLKQAALGRLEALRAGSRGIRWVRADQMHLTLKFLGETPASRAGEIETALAEAAAGCAPFEMSLGPGGVFPPAGPPRVIWLGVKPEDLLAAMAARIETALAPLGFAPERRPFRPHLTLGRAEPGAIFSRSLLIEPAQAPPESVSALALVRSELRPGGSIYTNMRQWELGRIVKGR